MQSGAEAANGKRKASAANEERKSNEVVKDSAARKQTEGHNFIGVPPNMTESSAHSGQGPDFVDEEEEEENQNNIITQAELFKNYSDQNSLYLN